MTQKVNEKLSCRKETVRLLRGSVLAKYNWKTIFCGHYRSIFNHCHVVGLQSYRVRWNNAKQRLLRRWRSFKVTDVSSNQTPVCNFLLVTDTDILSRTVSKLSQITVQILEENRSLRFEPSFGGI